MGAHRTIAVRLGLAVGIVLLVAGCILPGQRPDTGSPGTVPTDSTRAPVGPPLVFGGKVIDARSGDLLPEANVTIDLAQTQPCGRESIGWTSWAPAMSNGTWGPIEVPRPRSDQVAFFVHATAPGFGDNATFIGPTQAHGDIRNLTILLHPDAAVEGVAPAGSVIALDAPTFPRVTVAAANGSFRFEEARSSDAWLVAATDVPYRALVHAPAHVNVSAASGKGWTLEGSLKGPSGAPLAANIVAYNGSLLVSAARSSDTGAFALPLAPEPVSLRIVARTADDHYAAVKTIDINGPPALRESLLASALC